MIIQLLYYHTTASLYYIFINTVCISELHFQMVDKICCEQLLCTGAVEELNDAHRM